MIFSTTQFQPKQSQPPAQLPHPDGPRVSVIIPNYNHTRFISQAIHSVLAQTYRSFEIIVVDDGSTDNSREVMAQFEGQVRCIWQENQGLGAARNTGIRAAEGELIGLLDADDQWLPSYLETMVALADNNPDAAVFYSYAQGMDENGSILPQVFGAPVRPPGQMLHTLLRANFLIPSTILIRRSVVIESGLFEQKNRAIHGCEDWDLWLRLLPAHIFIGASKCLVRYRLHRSSLSASPDRMQKAAQAVIEKHFGPDDGQWLTWPPEKRRAYGGVYRYHLLTLILRQNDWQTGAQYLRQALQVDPTLAIYLDLFYDLALGSQPPGYRGTSSDLQLETNANQVIGMLAEVFCQPMTPELASIRDQTHGTAYYALGLVAYNVGQLTLSRKSLLMALRFRPDLWRDGLVVKNLLKTFLGHFGLACLRRLQKISGRRGDT